MASETTTFQGSALPRLRRELTLRDLIVYGVVAVTPSGGGTVFGLASVLSNGHAVTAILFAMVAMTLTAVSYGRMAALYPAAGSAYTYVARSTHPYLGFLAGWAMLLDYLLIPLFCVLYGSLSIQRMAPELPFVGIAAVFALAITVLNVAGIRATARANLALIASMGAALLVFDFFAAATVVRQGGWDALFSIKPFYDPATFGFGAVARATSFAAFAYLGFDTVTTLAEDVVNPRRNVMRAAVGVCLFTGVFGGLLVYLSQLVWPDFRSFPHVETAFFDVAKRAGGDTLFQAMATLLVFANVGAGLTGQVGAAPLLFGMGRDGVLPQAFFSHLDPKRNAPTYNIALLGILSFAGALYFNYETVAEVLNFGAFLGFMSVNAAAIWRLSIQGGKGAARGLADAVVPALGLVFCFIIWWGLAPVAKMAGAAWFALGVLFLLARTSGFKRRLDLAGIFEG